MGRRYKEEVGHEYGPYLVIDYTPFRTHHNGCVIWRVRCKHCGQTDYIDGDVLRFHRYSNCSHCGRRD